LIISGAVEITERNLREVLVPRRAVFTLDADLPVDAARAHMATSAHSRAPVVRNGNLDDTVGVVHIRDLLLAAGPTVADVARPAVLMPDSLRVADALRRFRAEREQIALVVDEHGAVDGIVTLEDLVEEIVGEIYDEHDRDVEAVQRDEDGTIVLPGTFPVHDLPDLGVDLDHRPDGGYTTVAGLITCPPNPARRSPSTDGTPRSPTLIGARSPACDCARPPPTDPPVRWPDRTTNRHRRCGPVGRAT
jgi:putative hemolysin